MPSRSKGLEDSSDPLQRFQVMRTSDPEVLRHTALTVFGASDVDLTSEGFHAEASFARMHGLALAFASMSTDIRLVYPEADYYRFQFGVHGRACTVVGATSPPINSRMACVTSPHHVSQMICDGGHTRLTLRINASDMTRKLGALLGGLPSHAPELEPTLDMTEARCLGLLHAVVFLARLLNSQTATFAPLAVREMEQAIVVAALTATEHAYTRRLDGWGAEVAPLHIRLAEEFIEANWNRAISIEELAELTGVGARTLFRTFKKLKGYSPMQFARLVRLRRARIILSAPRADTSIVGTALACGFLNPGHFARYYQEAFGELPSHTLARHV